MRVRLPDDTQRLGIFGATGSGKTQAALWHLSQRSWPEIPWVIYNTKSDATIDGIPYSKQIDIGEIPDEPGVFIVKPLPHEQEELEAHQWAVWETGDMGVYIDEGFAMGVNNKPFRSLLTQGRSKRIPMIVLSQRPVWIDRYVFSESEFLQTFRLQHAKDRKAMEDAIPRPLDRLPDYYSWYYDGLGNKVWRLSPVPSLESIYSTFSYRSKRLRESA